MIKSILAAIVVVFSVSVASAADYNAKVVIAGKFWDDSMRVFVSSDEITSAKGTKEKLNVTCYDGWDDEVFSIVVKGLSNGENRVGAFIDAYTSDWYAVYPHEFRTFNNCVVR